MTTLTRPSGRRECRSKGTPQSNCFCLVGGIFSPGRLGKSNLSPSGQSESGKSTLLKQFQILHSPDAFEQERSAWKTVIHLNLVKSVGRILEAITDFDSSPDSTTDHNRPLERSSAAPSQGHIMLRLRLSPLRMTEEALIRKLASPTTLHTQQATIGGADSVQGVSWSLQLTSPKEFSVRSNGLWKAFGGQDTIADETSVILNAAQADMLTLWGDPVVHAILREKRINLSESSGL